MGASRGKMSERVRASEVLFELRGVGVVETEMPSGCLRRANAAFCEMVGYSEAELQRLTYLELTHPDDRARDAERFAALARGEHRPGASLTRVLRKDGGVVWLELHVTLVGEGDEALNLTVVNDVTERVCSEAATRASHSRTAEILESISDAFYALDADFTFTYVNKKAEEW